MQELLESFELFRSFLTRELLESSKLSKSFLIIVQLNFSITLVVVQFI